MSSLVRILLLRVHRCKVSMGRFFELVSGVLELIQVLTDVLSLTPHCLQPELEVVKLALSLPLEELAQRGFV